MKKLLSCLILTGICSTSLFAVINGDSAKDSRYDAVGAIRIEGKIACTGTLIADKWIVTARHCTEGGESEDGESIPMTPSDYEFRLGNDPAKPLFASKLKRWVNIPAVKVGEEMKEIDMVFGELVKAVPLEKLSIKPISAVSQKWYAEDLKANYTLIGFGVRIPFGTSTSPLEGKRQLANFKVTGAKGPFLLNLFGIEENFEYYIKNYHTDDIDLEMESIDRLLRDDSIPGHTIHAWDPRGRADVFEVQKPKDGWKDSCFGDSGGPLLREFNGSLQIVGVVSQGMNGTCAALGTQFTTFGKETQNVMKKYLPK